MKAHPERTLAEHYPLTFCSLLSLALVGLALLSETILPRTVISSAGNLPPELRSPPSDREQAFSALIGPENLFWVLIILLAVALLTRFDWWREAGFNRPSQWRNCRFLIFPLLVGALAPIGGIRAPELAFIIPALLGALLAAFGEEVVFRGIMWNALVSKGLVRAVVATSLLSSALFFARGTLAGPWPEALLLTAPVFCASFTYAVLRWRTVAVWPVILLHFALGFLAEISTPGTVPYLVPLLFFASTLGFLGYGLLLLRRSRV